MRRRLLEHCASILLAASLAAVAASASDEARAGCRGRVLNPVTDVCWSCLFPIKVGDVRLSDSGVSDPDTEAPAVCTCRSGAAVQMGFNLSFWEPLRTVEIVREPYCFPSLGGVEMGEAGSIVRAAAHGRSAERHGSVADADGSGARHTAFYQAHWYHTPWLFVLQTMIDSNCIEQSAWDLAYLTELDPLWDDALASFVLAPESAIFANPAAAAGCMLDCAAATVMTPRPELFWCNGCQGSLYPLSGWVAAMNSPLQAWHLIAGRMTVKLAREGLLWAAYGRRGQCGPYFEPIPRKDVWRTQLVYPSATASGGRCCRPLGSPTQPWGRGKSFPVDGEDGAVLLWRKRDCCASQGLM